MFSFHPVKHVTTGEGGAVVTHDRAFKRRVDRLRQHGIERDATYMDHPPAGPWAYEVVELGWNYRLSDLACALGLSQLAKLDPFVARRRELAAMYRALLRPEIAAPVELADRESAYHLFAIAVDWARFGTTRARVAEQLASEGVGTQVHYIPLTEQPLHKRRCPTEHTPPGAARYYDRTLSLPLFPAMTPGDVGDVVAKLHRVLGDPQ